MGEPVDSGYIMHEFVSPFDNILEHLERLKIAHLRAMAGRWGVASVAAAFAAFGLGIILAQLGFVTTAAWLVLGAWLAAISTLGARLYWERRRFSDATFVAAYAGDIAPQLGQSVLSAVALRTAENPRGSKDLIDAHVVRTDALLIQCDLPQQERQTQEHHWRPVLQWSGGAIIATIILALFFTSGARTLWHKISNPNAMELYDSTLIGDIRLVYHYPEYTGHPPKEVAGGDGSIAAIEGTQISFQATTDLAVTDAFLWIGKPGDPQTSSVRVSVREERELSTTFVVDKDAAYYVGVETTDGRKLRERHGHPIRVTTDQAPIVTLEQPNSDVEVRDDQDLKIHWRAKDDFGVTRVELVISSTDAVGQTEELQRLVISAPNETLVEADGDYTWKLTVASVPTEGDTTLHIEAYDNHQPPNVGSSSRRRLAVESAQSHHEDLLEAQRQALDGMIDWLAEELETPVPTEPSPWVAEARDVHQKIVGLLGDLNGMLAQLIVGLREDPMTPPDVANAFNNVHDHVNTALQNRVRWGQRLDKQVGRSSLSFLNKEQERAVAQLEKDIIYLDDLLAQQRVDALKHSAEQLLKAQREMRDLLEEYKTTQDPELKQRLEAHIRALRQQMRMLLAKMSAIRERLPQEYRNSEAASMLELDDQVARLEQLLEEDNLDKLAEEVEELASMIENTLERLDAAEQDVGGERYSELNAEIQEFSQEFERLQAQQEMLAKRAEKLTQEYRKQAIKEAAGNLDTFVKKARKLVADALLSLDEVALYPGMFAMLQKETVAAQQRLTDLDALLEQRDFAEAREFGRITEIHSGSAADMLETRRSRAFLNDKELRRATGAAKQAHKHVLKINEMLDKLFPNPQDVLKPQQRRQMQQMSQKQGELSKKAEEVRKRMEQLESQIPIFGEQPRSHIQDAQAAMGHAQDAMQDGELIEAARQKRSAADKLKAVRDALKEAAQQNQGGGGIPMPLAGAGQGGRRDGSGRGQKSEDVEIPAQDKGGAPRFRKELLEAAKQKPPEAFKDAVRRYYEELIR